MAPVLVVKEALLLPVADTLRNEGLDGVNAALEASMAHAIADVKINFISK